MKGKTAAQIGALTFGDINGASDGTVPATRQIINNIVASYTTLEGGLV